MNPTYDENTLELISKLWTSPLYFTQFFYKIMTGRDFIISKPVSREPHQIVIARELKNCFKGEENKLLINIPPRYGKTVSLIYYVAWCLSQRPYSNFLYISYSLSLAKRQTKEIRDILLHPTYKKLFGVEIRQDTSAKSDYETTVGGSVYAAGIDGTITGRGAGVKGLNEMAGAIIADDLHKPGEADSDVIRQATIDNFYNTVYPSRKNSDITPVIFIGQRVHEADIASKFLEEGDWRKVIMPALDIHNNPLDPAMHDRNQLLMMKEHSPYVFAAQYQQDPQPAGGGLYKPEWFALLDDEPNFLCTFITCDTAESTKTQADYTVFSFWGVYRIENSGFGTNTLGLHWIDCVQDRMEPKDLYPQFMDFWAACSQCKKKPSMAAIEKKSSGSTLLSVISDLRGIQTRAIERGRDAGGKTTRFLSMQSYLARRLVSLPRYGKHTHMCIEHMKKITANESHRYDDICDTVYDAVKLVFIDKTMDFYIEDKASNQEAVLSQLVANQRKILDLKGRAYR